MRLTLFSVISVPFVKVRHSFYHIFCIYFQSVFGSIHAIWERVFSNQRILNFNNKNTVWQTVKYKWHPPLHTHNQNDRYIWSMFPLYHDYVFNFKNKIMWKAYKIALPVLRKPKIVRALTYNSGRKKLIYTWKLAD